MARDRKSKEPGKSRVIAFFELLFKAFSGKQTPLFALLLSLIGFASYYAFESKEWILMCVVMGALLLFAAITIGLLWREILSPKPPKGTSFSLDEQLLALDMAALENGSKKKSAGYISKPIGASHDSVLGVLGKIAL